MKKINKCFLCQHKDFVVLTSLKDERVEKCKNCGLVFLNPQVINTKVDEYEILDLDKFFNYILLFRSKQYKNDLKEIKRYVKKGNLLDVGCSQGWFLKEALRSGFRATGVEPSRLAVSWAAKHNPGVKIIGGELSKKQFRKSSFDVVTLWSVLEHTTNPDMMVKKVYYYVKKGGIFALRIPNYDSLLVKIGFLMDRLGLSFGKKALRNLYQCDFAYKHFYHFDQQTISKLLKKNNFKILKVYYENSFDASLINKRATASKNSDWQMGVDSRLLKYLLRLVFYFAKLIRQQDEVVIIARKVA